MLNEKPQEEVKDIEKENKVFKLNISCLKTLWQCGRRDLFIFECLTTPDAS